MAWAIDWILTSILVAVAAAAAGAFAVVVVLASVLYYPLMESSAGQGTVGKRVCGLAVTDRYGRRLSFGRAFGRYLAKIPSALLFGIGFLMIGINSRKRGLHDLIAGTLVLRRP